MRKYVSDPYFLDTIGYMRFDRSSAFTGIIHFNSIWCFYSLHILHLNYVNSDVIVDDCMSNRASGKDALARLFLMRTSAFTLYISNVLTFISTLFSKKVNILLLSVCISGVTSCVM